jgi:hypothetical protein
MAVTFTKFLRANDFNAGSTATDIAITSGQYNQIGYKTVGAQQQIFFGAGAISNGVDSRETAKIRFDSAAGAITGTFRLAVQDANGLSTIPVVENDNTNFTSGIKLGIKAPGAREDSKLLILFNPDTSTTIDYSDSDNNVNIPVTVVNLN